MKNKTQTHASGYQSSSDPVGKQASLIAERQMAASERAGLAAAVELDAILRANPDAAKKLGGFVPLSPSIAARTGLPRRAPTITTYVPGKRVAISRRRRPEPI
jgi:hypothetical protein